MKRRRLYLYLFLAALGLTVIIPVGIAQTRRAAQATPLQEALKALNEGRYDDVPSLVASLNPQDPTVASVKARALTARGKYSEAETLLRPLAQRAPTSEAALELALLLKMLGRQDANAMLQRFADGANRVTAAADLARAARALDALGMNQDANDLFREATNAAPKDLAIQLAWGQFFIGRNCRDCKPNALKSFDLVLAEDPKSSAALLGTAMVLVDEAPPKAGEFAKRALEVNPSYVDAYVFVASESVDSGRREEARKALQKALDVNPNSLDAHSLLAALAYVEDKKTEFDAEVAKVLAIAPNHGELYRVVGEMAAHNYRFEEAVALTRRALALTPDDPKSQASLGVHLLRTGDEPGARAALDASWNKDGSDVVTYNLLNMMDTLDKFVTVKDGDLIVRMDKEEAPVIGPFVLSIAHQALDALQKRYQFKVTGPVLIEVFPKHDDFAVRNVGLPGMIGALGACFGKVVTMDSPRARPPGEFQWEATLWHELAHVVTLQMSQQRVPRWLTEGISVYEETLARPEWGRGQEMQFAQMLNEGAVLKLKDLNSGFTDPRMISMAYFQASLLVEHLVSRFGDQGLHKMLYAFGEGLDTDAALKKAVNTDLASLQDGFDQAMDTKFGALRKAIALPEKSADILKMPPDALKGYVEKYPGNYQGHMLLGEALRKGGDLDGAMKAFEAAAALAPVARGADSPHEQMAAIALEKKDKKRAIAELKALIKVDFDNVEAPRELAKLFKEENITDPAEIRPVYHRINAIDPFDADAQAVLGRLAMQRNEHDAAARHFTAVLALKPVDLASAHTDLAESYFKGGKKAEAKRETLAALEIAPGYERAQSLLLELAGAR